MLATNAAKHAGAGYRVLMVNPGSITAEFWFGEVCKRACSTRESTSSPASNSPADAVNAAIETFRPNVLVAVESTAGLQSLDLPLIYEYKRRRGCLRLFVPVWR